LAADIRAGQGRPGRRQPARPGDGAVAALAPTASIPRRTPAERRRARRRASLRKYLTVILLLSPWIVGFVVFTAGPMVLSFYYSFTHYDLISHPHWIGLDNYRFMFGKLTLNGRADQGDPFFWTSVKNTIWIIAFGVPL